jgi:hypothetical protein
LRAAKDASDEVVDTSPPDIATVFINHDPDADS